MTASSVSKQTATPENWRAYAVNLKMRIIDGRIFECQPVYMYVRACVCMRDCVLVSVYVCIHKFPNYINLLSCRIPLIRLDQDAGVEPHDRQSRREIRKPNDPVLRGPSEGPAEGTPKDPSLPEGRAGRRATRVLGQASRRTV